MNESVDFEIGSDAVDAKALVQKIRKTVQEKQERGDYADTRISRAERHNLRNLRDDKAFLEYYLQCLRDATIVDINDYSIQDRRGGILGKLLVKFKSTVWKTLKFYTYRLWSQQNQANGLIVTAIDGMQQQYEKRIAALEKQIEALSGNKPDAN